MHLLLTSEVIDQYLTVMFHFGAAHFYHWLRVILLKLKAIVFVSMDDSIGSYKSNYHTITGTTDPNDKGKTKIFNFIYCSWSLYSDSHFVLFYDFTVVVVSG